MSADGADQPTRPNFFLITFTSLVNVLLLVIVMRAVLAGLPAQLAALMLLFVLASSLAMVWMLWRYQPASTPLE